MPVGVLDLVGDVVSDAQGIRAVVLKMSNQGGIWNVDAYTQNSADGQNHEVFAQANNVTIVSHQDGIGLVSGGGSTPTPTLTPPSANKFFQKSY